MLATHNRVHGFSPADTILSQSSPAFDLSVAQIFGALTSGATLALAKASIRKDPVALAAFMRRVGVTVTYFPATQFAALLEYASADLSACTAYRRALFAGEVLPVWLARATYDALGATTPLRLYNQYGPSETGVQTTSSLVPYPDPDLVALPVGYPLSNCSHYIVDAAGHPVPRGIVGEIYIGGAQVSKGYLNSAAAGAAAFLNDKFASDAFRHRGWNIMYKTGDKARFLPDGQLDFRGRIKGDRQRKMRGFRIDLREIENELFAAALNAVTLKVLTASVRLVSVHVMLRDLGSSNGPLDTRSLSECQIVAFLQLDQDNYSLETKQSFVNTLHQATRPHLNTYMLPSGYQIVNSLSGGLISGKVGLKQLQTIDLDLLYPTDASFLDAETEANSEIGLPAIVNLVAETFRAVLKLPPGREIASSESFFNLGGHSMLVLRLAAAIRRKFEVVVGARDIFGNPTPAAIALLIAKAKGHDVNDIPPIQGGSSQASKSLKEITIDWEAEAALPADDIFHTQPSSSFAVIPGTDVREVLLTGVESPIGSHMLARLLTQRPDVNVTLIGTHQPLTYDKVQNILLHSNAQLIDSWYTLISRIRILPDAHLASHSPLLGLTRPVFEALASRIQLIYHFGAHVSLLMPYADLRTVNVQATSELLRLSSLARRVRGTATKLVHLSTWSVAHLQAWPSNTRRSPGAAFVTSEQAADYFVPGPDALTGAYFKARWVAEELIRRAAERNLVSATIVRTSAVADIGQLDSISSRSQESDSAATPRLDIPSSNPDRQQRKSLSETNFFLGLVKAVTMARQLPDLGHDLRMDIDFITPQYAVFAIDQLSINSHGHAQGLEDQNHTASFFHVRNPSPLRLDQLVSTSDRSGQLDPLFNVVPLPAWIENIKSAYASMEDPVGVESSSEVFITVLRDYLELGHQLFSLDNDRSSRALAASFVSTADLDLTCPPAEQYFLRQLREGE